MIAKWMNTSLYLVVNSVMGMRRKWNEMRAMTVRISNATIAHPLAPLMKRYALVFRADGHDAPQEEDVRRILKPSY